MQDNDARNEYAKFFHLDNAHPSFLGSLRGMVRTLVKIVGYGKMQWVTDEPSFSGRRRYHQSGQLLPGHLLIQEEMTRIALPIDAAGYLESRGSLVIRPAQTIDDHFRTY